MAIEVDINSENPTNTVTQKTNRRQNRESHPENKIVDEEAKITLEDDLLATEKYPPQNLINWNKTEDKKKRNTRWQNSENNMKSRKKGIEWNKDTKKMKRNGFHHGNARIHHK
jgi:hypothetical protein